MALASKYGVVDVERCSCLSRGQLQDWADFNGYEETIQGRLASRITWGVAALLLALLVLSVILR